MPSRHYWPALDGIRGAAMLLVIACHAGFVSRAAGAMAVTVFFVLSGFLITKVLTEREERLRSFYGARAVRLLPALTVMVAVVAVVWFVQGRPAGPFVEYAATALFYVENFFTPSHIDAVFTHAWSLAVEEQFYLLWPLLLPLVLRVRRTAWLLWALVIGGVVVRAAVLETAGPVVAYASLPSNAYALLLGCLLALAPWRFGLRKSSLVIGTLAVIFSFMAAPYFPGGLVATAPCAAFGGALLIHGAQQGSVLYNWAPLRFCGRISYAWYLWHWPLLWLADDLFARVDALPMIGLSLVVAVVSTFWIEEPLRRRWRTRAKAGYVAPAADPVGAGESPAPT